MFLGMLFASIFGNGAICYNKNKRIKKNLEQMRKEGRGYIMTKDKDVMWEEPPSLDTGKWYYKGWLFKLR